MLIIEIHVERHEDNPASTRASEVREDVQTRPQNIEDNPIRRLIETIQAWFNDRETKSSHTNGF